MNDTTIRVDKKVVRLLQTYCAFNNLKMKDYVSEVISEDLKDFKEKMDEFKKLNMH